MLEKKQLWTREDLENLAVTEHSFQEFKASLFLINITSNHIFGTTNCTTLKSMPRLTTMGWSLSTTTGDLSLTGKKNEHPLGGMWPTAK